MHSYDKYTRKQLIRLASEMSEEIISLNEEIKDDHIESQYLYDFISWKGLNEDYAEFVSNAHLEYDDELPFGTYVL